MVVRIDLSGVDPPSGTVAFDGEDGVAFTGWLGLLGALTERVGPVPPRRGGAASGGDPSAETDVAVGDRKDELGPRGDLELRRDVGDVALDRAP